MLNYQRVHSSKLACQMGLGRFVSTQNWPFEPALHSQRPPTKWRPKTATRAPQGIFWFIDQFHKSIYFSFQILEARCESIAWSCWEVSWNTMVEQHVLTIRNEGGSLQFPLSYIIIACGWKSKICRTFNQWRLGICWIWQEKNTKCRPVKIYGNTFWLQNVGTVQNSQPMIYKNLQEGFRLVDPLMNVRPNATLKEAIFMSNPLVRAPKVWPCQSSPSTPRSEWTLSQYPWLWKLVGETDLGCPWAIGKLLQHVTPSSHGGSDKGCGPGR